METKHFILLVDFDSKKTELRETKLDKKVGDYFNLKGVNYIVYSSFYAADDFTADLVWVEDRIKARAGRLSFLGKINYLAVAYEHYAKQPDGAMFAEYMVRHFGK